MSCLRMTLGTASLPSRVARRLPPREMNRWRLIDRHAEIPRHMSRTPRQEPLGRRMRVHFWPLAVVGAELVSHRGCLIAGLGRSKCVHYT
jgi:hypothetical protein